MLLDEEGEKYRRTGRMNLTDNLEFPRGKIRYLGVID
jgi:hypothetical protein